jgi:uncharacterized protein (TIGR02145 family)
MKMKRINYLRLLVLTVIISCFLAINVSQAQQSGSGTIYDVDGNSYNTVTIGSQVWMAENLKTTKYSDGTSIPLVTDNSAWGALTTPGYCWYNNDEATYKDPYGALYNWYAMDAKSNGGKNVCPIGWFVPYDAEWTILTLFLGGENIAGGKMKSSGTEYWQSPNTDGTNMSGFSGLPGGGRGINNYFYNIGNFGLWWNSSEYNTEQAWNRSLHFSYGGIGKDYYSKRFGFSVRCTQNSSPAVSTTGISSIASISALCTGNVSSNGGTDVTARGFCWSTNSNPTIDLNMKTLDGSGLGTFTSTIKDLSAGTTYYIRSYATNSSGTAYGNEISFKTYNSEVIVDIDGNHYYTVTIGSQVWMVENLRTTKYSDGTSIPLVTDNTAWAALTAPGYCWYDNDEETYKDSYGALYNWYAVDATSNGGKNVCPVGWHVPADEEWTTLAGYLTNNGYGYGGGGNDIAKSMAAKWGWLSYWEAGSPGNNQESNNSSGFSALPSGHREYYFNSIGSGAYWWSSMDNSSLYPYLRFLTYASVILESGYVNKFDGLNVRCLKDVTEQQSIDLSEGWNIISFAVEPNNMAMSTIVDPLINAGTLIKVQNERGKAIERLAEPIGWIDEIGQMAVTEGYKIKVTENTIPVFSGKPVTLPMDIPLAAGWNIIGYPVLNSQSSSAVFGQMIAEGNLLKVQDEAGNAIEQLPDPVGWVDNIVNLVPGKGYKVKTSLDTKITIGSASKGENQIVKSSIVQPVHFHPGYKGNGLDHMNIYIKSPTVGGVGLKQGDEIGVFDGGVCVGASVFNDVNQEYLPVIVSLDDPTTQERDGFTEGNAFEIRLWEKQAGTDRKVQSMEIFRGYNNLFDRLGTSVLGVDFEAVPSDFLGDAYPNPSSEKTTFTFQLASESKVRLEIFNVMGDLVKVLFDQDIPEGIHEIEWDNHTGSGNKAKAGIYLYRLSVNDFSQTKQLVIY